MKKLFVTIAVIWLCVGSVWGQSWGNRIEQKIKSFDAESGDEFGWAVSSTENTIVVGAWAKNIRQGAAYVFGLNDDGTWSEVTKLTAIDGGSDDNFGWAVSISENTIAIGAHGSYASSVYLFEKNATGIWVEKQKLAHPDGVKVGGFGLSVDIFEEVLIVGAPYDNNGGAVYIYERNNEGTWELTSSLVSPTPSGQFGRKVSIHGSFMLVGAWTGFNLKGVSYVFEKQTNGSWQTIATLIPSDVEEKDYFGLHLDVGNGVAVVGAYGENSNRGAAYVFERNSQGNWVETQKLIASDGRNDDRFAEVSIVNDLVVIGATGDDDKGSQSGSAYIFSKNENGFWVEKEKLIAQDGTSGDQFGHTISVKSNFIAIGAMYDNEGSVYLISKDFDNDGIAATVDCNDNDPNIGLHQIWYADADGDGFGDPNSTPIESCNQPVVNNVTYVLDHTDCDDTNATIYPNAPELADGLDNDCDPATEDRWAEIPDANFRTYLEQNFASAMVDVDSDGVKEMDIQDSGVLEAGSILVESQQISDLSGIQYFINLNALDCDDNLLTSLPDLSSLSKLLYLDIDRNQLTSLPDLTVFPDLEILYCGANNLSVLPDVSSLDKLVNFYCNDLPAVTEFNGSLPNSIVRLEVQNTQITCLPNIPSSLLVENTVPQSVYLVCGTLPSLTLPTNFTSPQQSFTTIDLSWIDNNEGESGYKVLRSNDGTNFIEVAALAADATSYQDNNLTPSTTYFYKLEVFNDTESLTTEAIQVLTQEAPCISFPYEENFDGQSVYPQGWSTASNNTFNWEIFAPEVSPWEGNVAFIEGDFSSPFDAWLFSPQLFLKAGFTYTITFEYSGGGQVSFRQYQDQLAFAYGNGFTPADMTTVVFDNQFIQTSPMEVSHTITPTVSSVYHLGWHAKSAKGFAITIDKLNITAEAPEPAVPLNLVATPQSATEMLLEWEYSLSDPHSGFQMERSKNDTFTEEPEDASALVVIELPAGIQSYRDTGLSAGTTYYYRIRSKGADPSVPCE